MKVNMNRYIAYHYRRRDRKVVENFVQYNEGRLLAEYFDKEKWPQLAAALEKCGEVGATLVIVRLGRFVRNPHFLKLLMQSGVDFVCLDNPKCNPQTLHILLAVAETVSEQISVRMKHYVQVCAAKGIKLGSARPGHWDGREHLRGTRKAIARSAEMRRVRTRQTYEYLIPRLREWRMEGKTTQAIADILNQEGHVTTSGRPWTAGAVWRQIERYLGKDFLGKATDRYGNQQRLRCMEKST
jgi:DNA invertase Pin-like site-specific DNA recombinase